MQKSYTILLMICYVVLGCVAIMVINNLINNLINTSTTPNNTSTNPIEAFTPKIKQNYRPYIRKARKHYESFVGIFNPENVILKLKKMNVY